MYVATVTVMQSILQRISAPVFGFTQGVQLIISYNAFREKFSESKNDLSGLGRFQFCFFYGSYGFDDSLPQIFCFHVYYGYILIELVCRPMPIFSLVCYFLISRNTANFLGLGEARFSLFIALLRKAFLLAPLPIIFPKFFDVWGIYYAEPISDIRQQ